uniref:VAMP-like protein YKT61 n=1 Tax=Rhizophora mucronata TaxID=61149 RepID=A0A2P2KN28_RHIMU
MLDRLALAGRGPVGDGAADENNEFLDTGPLEETEMAHVRRVRQYNRIRSVRVALQHQ